MSEDKFHKRYEEYLKVKLEVFDKIPYKISKNISSEVFVDMSIEQIEKLNPSYKPPKEQKKELTPQEQDLADIDALAHPKFKIDLEDPKFVGLDPSVRNIYKDRFENLSKQLDKELSTEEPKYKVGKMSMRHIPSETIKYADTTVPIMSRKEIDTVDQEKKIKELRKLSNKFQDDDQNKQNEIYELNQRIRALKTEVAKERGLIE